MRSLTRSFQGDPEHAQSGSRSAIPTSVAAQRERGERMRPGHPHRRIRKRRFAMWSAMPATANMVARVTTQNPTAKLWSYPGMEKLCKRCARRSRGVSELFTLDAWRHGGMTELEEAELDRGSGPRSPGTQDRAGLSRPCQGDDAARICRDTQAACASLGAEAAGRTKQHRISKWRAQSISKCARKTTREQSRFGK